MLLLGLWNYIRGYVIILVEGWFPEKFINVCTRRQILLWDVKKPGDRTLELKVSVRGFRLLGPVARKTGTAVKIVKKCGLPFLLVKYKRRKALLAGAAIFVALICAMSSFIWDVEISTDEGIDKQALLSELKEYGIKPGVLKRGIDTKKIANRIMTENDGLSWLGISVRGTRVKVEAVKSVKPPELIPRNIPCDMIARRDGVLKSIVARAGLEMVKPGDTVMKGQVLISGTIPNKNDASRKRLVHAMGEVLARTWYEASVPVETSIIAKERTGREALSVSLIIFGRKLRLGSDKIPFEDCEKSETKKELSLPGDFILPFGLVYERYSENKTVEYEMSLEEAKHTAADKAFGEARKGMPEKASVTKTDISFTDDGKGRIRARVILECLEDLAVERKTGGG